MELIELSKTVKYSKQKSVYWQLNHPQANESIIKIKIKEARLKQGKAKYSKYLKMQYYNDIKSLDNIKKYLLDTYESESKAFKLLFSFGYVTEKYEEKIQTKH